MSFKYIYVNISSTLNSSVNIFIILKQDNTNIIFWLATTIAELISIRKKNCDFRFEFNSTLLLKIDIFFTKSLY